MQLCENLVALSIISCRTYSYLCPHLINIVMFSQPYDFLSLIHVIEGAGGVITDWKGNQLHWEASPDSSIPSMLISCKAFFYAFTVKFISFWFAWSYFARPNQIDNFAYKMLYYLLLYFPGFNVVAAADKQIHQQALDSLQWQWNSCWTEMCKTQCHSSTLKFGCRY